MNAMMMASAVSVTFGLVGLGTTVALATPCGDEIARVERDLRNSEGNPAIGPTARQSIGAQLRHQPTPESVGRAEADARAGVAAMLDRARAFDAEGKSAECMKAVDEARQAFE